MATTTLDRNQRYRLPITVIKGNTWRDSYALKQDTVGDGTSAVVSISGVTWLLKVSSKRDGTVAFSGASVAALTSTGIYVDSAANGQFTVNIAAADTAGTGITTGAEGYYEVSATFPAGTANWQSVHRTIMHGPYIVTEDA